MAFPEQYRVHTEETIERRRSTPASRLHEWGVFGAEAASATGSSLSPMPRVYMLPIEFDHFVADSYLLRQPGPGVLGAVQSAVCHSECRNYTILRSEHWLL